MGNNNILRIIVITLILISFFLPLNKTEQIGDMTIHSTRAWDFVAAFLSEPASLSDFPPVMAVMLFVFIIILLASLTILILSVMQKPVATMVRVIPFIALLFMLIYNFTQTPATVQDLLRSTGPGLYIMLIASFLLVFMADASAEDGDGLAKK